MRVSKSPASQTKDHLPGHAHLVPLRYTRRSVAAVCVAYLRAVCSQWCRRETKISAGPPAVARHIVS